MKANIFVFLLAFIVIMSSEKLYPQGEIIDQSSDTSSIDSAESVNRKNWPTVDINENMITAFTPNDDGINDIFMKDVEIKVFNRWGKEVYYGSEGWDGKKNGKTQPADTYYYIRYYRDANGDLLETSKGSVTIIRR